MGRRYHRTCGLLAAASLTLVGLAQPLDASGPTAVLARVRADHPRVAAAIQSGLRHSPTFRALVQAVNATDGLVWVDAGSCGGSVRACLALTVRIAGPYRLLRVVVDTRRPALDMIASLAHELRHALEALNDPTVRSGGAIYFFFQQQGEPSGGRFETDAAIAAGDQVRRELRAASLD